MSHPTPNLPTAHGRKAVRRPRCRRGPRRGFSLVEVLATLLLVAIAVPVMMSAVSAALNTASAARRRTEAASLAESKLSELVATGDWQTAATNGDFPDNPDYQWSCAVQDWGDGSVEELDVTISWFDKGAQKTYVVSTLVYPNVTPAAQDQAAQDAASAAASTGTGTSAGTGSAGGGK